MSSRLKMLVHLLFLASGAMALVYEVAWTRSLSLIFGASYEAVAIVLAAYMGGLALGGFAGGRLAGRVRRGLLLYGWLEIGIAGFALLLPWLLRLVQGAYVELALRAGGVGAGVTLMRILLAGVVLLLPTALMGATLPVLVRHLTRTHRDLGVRLSRLYAVNTLGAVLGTLAAGFLLLPALGVAGTQHLAVIVNLMIGVAAILVGRRSAASDEDAAAGQEEAPAPEAAAHPWPLRLAFYGTAVAGFGALALEVAWFRAISVATGSTTYSLSVMLAAFLLGIALGSLAHTHRVLRRLPVGLRFGVALAGIGVTSLFVSTLIPRLPELAVRLNLGIYGGFAGVRSATVLVLSFFVMLVPCLLMGAAFPLSGEARASLRRRPGASVGDVVGLNTAGAIAGTLATGFLLIPAIGLQRSMLVASSAYLAWGILTLFAEVAARRPAARRRAGAVAGILLAVALSLPFVMSRWDVRLLAEFQNNNMGRLLDADGEVDVNRWRDRTEVRYYREGRVANVSVIDTAGQRAVLINGKSVATDAPGDMQHEYLLGHLPTLLHTDPKSALVIGLGAGLTLGGVAAEEGIERIVVVEIEPAVLDAARLFSDLTDDATEDPRVEIVYQDGRNHLLTTRDRYDVITADPIHPWAQGAAYLYTSEYFGLIREHLDVGGVACQWLPLYELSEEDVRCVVRTFAGVFPETTLWQATSDALLIGSDAPLDIDVERLAERLRQPRVARQLARVGLDDPRSLLGEFAMDAAAVARFGDGAVVNTDDNLHLEFSSPHTTGTDVIDANTRLVDSFRTAFSEELAPYARAKSETVLASLDWRAGRQVQAVEACRRALEIAPDYRRAKVLLSRYLSRLGRGKEALAADPKNPAANFEAGVEHARRGRHEQAVPYFRRALDRRPWFPEASQNLGTSLTALSRFEEALEPLREAARWRPRDPVLRHNLGFAMMKTGRQEAAIVELRAAASLAPGRPVTAQVLAQALAAAGRYGEALAALREGLRRAADHAGLRLELAWLLATAPEPGLRDGMEALRTARRLARESGHPRVLDAMAAALAERGRFEDAADTAQKAVQAAESRGESELAGEIRGRLAGYRAGRPHRLGE